MNDPKRIYKPGQREAHWTKETTLMEASSSGADGGEEFPLDCLPSVAAKMASAIAHTERTPESLSGCCVLGILSGSIGSGLQVKSGPDRVTRGNLYLLTSAESGSGKSETFRHAAKPFLEFDRQFAENWASKKQPKLKSEAAMLKSEIVRLEKRKPTCPVEREEIRDELQHKMAELQKVNDALIAPALCCEDVTTEELAAMLARNAEQLASLSADAGVIVNNILGRYNKLDRTDEGIYLKSFSGDYCRVNRVSREPVILQRPCLSVLWLVQPDKVETLLGERSLTDGGLIPRFLPCHTHATARPIIEGMTGIPDSTASAWATLVQTLQQTYRLRPETVTIEPTREALQAMNVHHNGIVKRRLSELKDVNTYAARWNEQAWRIAVCLHAGTHGEKADQKLSLETAQAAIKIADWFSAQQLEILASGRRVAKEGKRTAILEMLVDSPKGTTAREVQRALHLTTAEEAHSLLEEMAREGILERTEVATGGRPLSLYRKAWK